MFLFTASLFLDSCYISSPFVQSSHRVFQQSSAHQKVVRASVWHKCVICGVIWVVTVIPKVVNDGRSCPCWLSWFRHLWERLFPTIPSIDLCKSPWFSVWFVFWLHVKALDFSFPNQSDDFSSELFMNLPRHVSIYVRQLFGFSSIDLDVFNILLNFLLCKYSENSPTSSSVHFSNLATTKVKSSLWK